MKKILSFLMAVCLIVGVPFCPTAYGASTHKMEIHGIYLSQPGDSTLLNLSGKWLLIDTGCEDTADELVAQLKKFGVESLDIYISHLHDDHYGGVAAVGENFNVNKIYLPHSTIGGEYEHQQYFLNKLFEDSGASEVKYLKKGSTFSYGGCTAEVLGPVGTYRLKDFEGKENGEGNKGEASHYLNNSSLTTKFTCGNISFLTCGDIEEEEESALLSYYKNGELKADVLKLSHHGLPTSSKPEFLVAVTPKYSFALNSGYSVYTSRKNAELYGLVCTLGDEKQIFGVKTDGQNISIYKGSTELSGWVDLSGSKTKAPIKYYIKNGKILTGIQTIDGKKYRFDVGGRLRTGDYDEGVYSPWDKTDDGIRAYSESGEMYTGFRVIDGNLCYLDPLTGLKKIGTKNWDIYKIGNKSYAINANGTVRRSGWLEYTSGGITRYRYFGSDGAMQTGWFTLNGRKYYLNPSTGFRERGFKNIGGKYYYFIETNNADYVYTGGWKKYGKKYRYFGTNGAMKTGWITVKGKKYYLNLTTGYREVGLKKIGKKTYYFEETKSAAYLRTSCWKKFGKKYRYFGSNGAMYTGWKKISGKYYYFDKSTGYSYKKTGLKSINGKKYYMQKSSKGSYRYNKKGWKKFGKKYRYFQKNGVVTIGWKKIGKSKYYFDKNGYRVTGTKKINGKKYKFDKNGKLKK